MQQPDNPTIDPQQRVFSFNEVRIMSKTSGNEQESTSSTSNSGGSNNSTHGNSNSGSSSISTIDDEPDSERDTPAPSSARTIAVADHGDQMTGEKVELTLFQSEGDNGSQPVFIGLNGHGTLIPRGVRVKIPVEVVDILDNAVQTLYTNVNNVMVPREVKRYAYTLHTRQRARAGK